MEASERPPRRFLPPAGQQARTRAGREELLGAFGSTDAREAFSAAWPQLTRAAVPKALGAPPRGGPTARPAHRSAEELLAIEEPAALMGRRANRGKAETSPRPSSAKPPLFPSSMPIPLPNDRGAPLSEANREAKPAVRNEPGVAIRGRSHLRTTRRSSGIFWAEGRPSFSFASVGDGAGRTRRPASRPPTMPPAPGPAAASPADTAAPVHRSQSTRRSVST